MDGDSEMGESRYDYLSRMMQGLNARVLIADGDEWQMLCKGRF